MSSNYWANTKPTYMPDSEWEKLQAKKKAEEEAKNKKNTVSAGNPIGGFSALADEAVKNGTLVSNSTPTVSPNTKVSIETPEYWQNTKPNFMPDEEWEKTHPTSTSGNKPSNSTPTAPSGNAPVISADLSAPVNGVTQGADLSSSPNATVSYKTPSVGDTTNFMTAVYETAKSLIGDPSSLTTPTYATASKPDEPSLRSLEELAEKYDIKYDYNAIKAIFDDSVKKKYEAMYERQKQNEAKYYDNAVAAQNTLLDTLARDRGSAVQAGVSRGMQAANALGAMLGVSQQFADNATALSQERGNMAKDYGADLAQAVVDAEAASNERKNAVMEIAKMLYGYDSEQYVAAMDNYNTILTNNVALQQTHLQNQADMRNALASILGGALGNKVTGDANIASAALGSEGQQLAAYLTAEANKHIADLQYGVLEDNEVGTSDTTTSTDTKSNVTGNSVPYDYWTVPLPPATTMGFDSEQQSTLNRNLATAYEQSGNTSMAALHNAMATLNDVSTNARKGLQADVDSVAWVLQDMWRNLQKAFGIK